MLSACYILLFLLLSMVVYQDFRFKGVYWIAFPLLLVICCIYRFLISPSLLWENTVINFAFVLSQIALVHAYFYIKYKRIVKIINVHLGLGDILFLLCISPLFSLLSYIVFYSVSLFISLIATLVYISISKKQLLIPLAGFQAVILMITLVSLIVMRRPDLMTFDFYY